MPYKIGQLLIHDPHHSKKTGEIFIEPPETNLADSCLMLLVCLDSNQPAEEQFIEQLWQATRLAYENFKLANPEKALEQVLQKLNQEIALFAPKNKNWLNNFHCLLALASDGWLHFSGTGNIKTYLIKPTLIKEIAEPTAEPADKIFSQLTSGQLKTEDKILFTSESLLDYLALEKIKKTIATLPPKSAIAHFQNLLQTALPEISFFALVLQTLEKSSVATATKEKPYLGKLNTPTTSKNSLDQLLAVEKATEKILTPPSFFHSLKQYFFRNKGWAKNSSLTHPWGKVGRLIIYSISAWRFLSVTIKKIWLLLTAQGNLKKLTEAKLGQLTNKFKQLPRSHRHAMMAIAVLLLLFSQSLIWQSQRQTKKQEEYTYQKNLQAIENEKAQITAALIYNDIAQTKSALQEILEIFTQLPQNSKARINKNQELQKQIQKIYEKIWQVTNIGEPLVLTDFKELNPQTEVNSLVMAANRLYSFTLDKQVLIYDLGSNEKKIIRDLAVQLKQPLYSDKLKKIIGIDAEKRFYSLSEEATLNELPASWPLNLQEIDDLDIFGERLYLLDKNSKQIYRLTLSNQGLNNPQIWLKEDLMLEQAQGLAIDGYLYLLLPGGEVSILSGGKKQDSFKITLEPNINKAKIYTDSSNDFIYLLDPENKRLVITDKKGRLKRQYYSEKFNNLKDFVVQEKEKKAYLLNGSQIYVIALQ